MKDAVFGELQDIYQGLYLPKRLWQGQLNVDTFKEPLRVSFETIDDLGVQPFHYQAFEDFKNHQQSYKALALQAIFEYYHQTILPLWKENNYFGVPELASTLVPNINTLEEMETLLSYPILHLHPPREGVNCLGLSFECTWDVEHGVGVLLLGDKVEGAGPAEVATRDV